MCIHCLQAVGVASVQPGSVQYHNTGPYALPGVTCDNNKDQGVSI